MAGYSEVRQLTRIILESQNMESVYCARSVESTMLSVVNTLILHFQEVEVSVV